MTTVTVTTQMSVPIAHEKYGISKARIYELLGNGKIGGNLSKKRGRSGSSWVDVQSLEEYLQNRPNGRPPIKSVGEYVSVSTAAEMSGYTPQRIYQMIDEGRVTTKQTANGGILVLYSSLFEQSS